MGEFQQQTEQLQEHLQAHHNGVVRYEARAEEATDQALPTLVVTKTQHGTTTETRFDAAFFTSNEYQSVRMLGERLRQVETGSITVKRGESTDTVSSFAEALEWYMRQARRGLGLQRYKGLGEMNPEQLWDTTMDPSQRRLLKVVVEDDVASDDTFTTLMGDQVEPRREFIESNAFSVSNLDV